MARIEEIQEYRRTARQPGSCDAQADGRQDLASEAVHHAVFLIGQLKNEDILKQL